MYQPLKSQALERKISNALNGDTSAMNELVDIVNTQSRISNQRMTRLKNAGLDFASYSRVLQAAHELGDDKFHKWKVEDAEMNIEDFIFQARETRLFLSRRQSTVSGAKDRLNEYLTMLEQYNWIKSKDSYTQETQYSLARLMSEGLKDLLSTFAFSEKADDSVEYIADALDSGRSSYDQVQRLISEILEGSRVYEDLFDVL